MIFQFVPEGPIWVNQSKRCCLCAVGTVDERISNLSAIPKLIRGAN